MLCAATPLASAARSKVHGAALLAQPIRTSAVRPEKREICVSVFEEIPMHGKRDRQIAARANLQKQVGLPGNRCGPWIDDDQSGTAVACLFQVGHDVNAGMRWIHTPQNDGFRVGIILIADRRHLAVERQVRHPSVPHRPCNKRDARNRRNSAASVVSCVSNPFEPPCDRGRIDSEPNSVLTSRIFAAMSSRASSHSTRRNRPNPSTRAGPPDAAADRRHRRVDRSATLAQI